MCVSNFVLIIFFSEMYGRQEQGEIGFFQTYPKMKKDVIKWYYSAKISKLAKLSPSFTIKHCRVQYYIMFTNIFSLETSLLWLGFFFILVQNWYFGVLEVEFLWVNFPKK